MKTDRRGPTSPSSTHAEPWEAILNSVVLDAMRESAGSENDCTEVSDDQLRNARPEWETSAHDYPQSRTECPIRDPAKIFLNRSAAFLKSREDGPELLARLRGMLVGDGPDGTGNSSEAQPAVRTAQPDVESEDS
jgi:hypothetical protein